MYSRHLLPWLTASVLLCACSRPEPPQAVPAVQPTSAPASAPETAARWVGRWQGPEGTFLDISGGPGTHRVTISNLDGPRSFDAKAGSESLVILRDGTTETLRQGSGVDTGMKWLADKQDCLVVKRGEGYCRD